MYLQLLGTLPKVPWKGLMYQNQARPKAIFIMWLQVQGRILIADRLQNWGIQIDDTCCFCQQMPEIKDHIFVECGYGRNLWNRLMHWLQIQHPSTGSWPVRQQWIVMKTNGRSKMARLLKLVYTEYHTTWIERNSRIFEQ